MQTINLLRLPSYYYVVVGVLCMVTTMMIVGYVREEDFMKTCIKSGGFFYPTLMMGDYCLP